MRGIPDTAETEWRFGFVETWAEGFNDWVRQHETVTIKPGESIAQIEAALTRDEGVKVRLYVPDF